MTQEVNVVPDDAKAEVVRRRVHYLSGFDPRGAAYYYRLYRDEMKKQAEHGKVTIQLGPRRKIAPHVYSWQIKGQVAGQETLTDYQFMAWDDWVRQFWNDDLLSLLKQGVIGYCSYVLCGAAAKIKELHFSGFITFLYPPLFMLLLLLGVIGIAIFSGVSVYSLSQSLLLSVSACLVLGAAAIWAGLRLGEYLDVFWLLRSILSSYFIGAAQQPELDQRITYIAKHIVQQQQQDPVDEILIIGHSSGSILAMSAVARMIQTQLTLDNFTLLTLGQCIPMVTFLPSAASTRADLTVVAESPCVPWIDASAKLDRLAFYQFDPVKTTNMHDKMVNRPYLYRVSFFKMFSPETYKKIRKDMLQLHFQYILASELPAKYDYFHITAGPWRISDLLKNKQ